MLLASRRFYDSDLCIIYGALFFIWSLDQPDDMTPYCKWGWGGTAYDLIQCFCYIDESAIFISCTMGGGWEEIHCHVKSIEVAHAGLCCWMPMIPRNSVSRATLRSHCPNYSTKGQRACRFSCQPSSSTPDLTYLINWSQSSESWLVKLCALDWLEQKPAATRLFVE